MVSMPAEPLIQLVAFPPVSVFQLLFCAPLQYAALGSTTVATTSCSAVAAKLVCSEKVRPPPIATVLDPPANLNDPVKTEPLLKVSKS